MRLTELPRTVELDAGSTSLVVGEDWLQGRSAFGGLQAALAVIAMRSLVPAGLPLRTLQTTFIAPVPPDRALAQARVLRVGKSATQVEARLLQGAEVLAIVIGVFGSARPSTIARSPSMPSVDATQAISLPCAEGSAAPSFTWHFAARWIHGGLPFTGNPSSASVVELDLIDSGPMSEAHLIAIADFIPPVALSMLDRPTPGASMTWMLEVVRERYDDQRLDGGRVDAQMLAAASSYTSQSTLIFAPDGKLAATSHQSMVVFG